MADDVVIVAAGRTPVGSLGGAILRRGARLPHGEGRGVGQERVELRLDRAELGRRPLVYLQVVLRGWMLGDNTTLADPAAVRRFKDSCKPQGRPEFVTRLWGGLLQFT